MQVLTGNALLATRFHCLGISFLNQTILLCTYLKFQSIIDYFHSTLKIFEYLLNTWFRCLTYQVWFVSFYAAHSHSPLALSHFLYYLSAAMRELLPCPSNRDYKEGGRGEEGRTTCLACKVIPCKIPDIPCS